MTFNLHKTEHDAPEIKVKLHLVSEKDRNRNIKARPKTEAILNLHQQAAHAQDEDFPYIACGHQKIKRSAEIGPKTDISGRYKLKQRVEKERDISTWRHLDSHTHRDRDLNFQCLPLGKHRCTQE